MSGHTPGPWTATACNSAGTLVYHRVTSGATRIAGVYDANEANAKLIAAAPDLADALRSLINTMEPPRTVKATTSWDVARAILAKAGL